MSLENLTAPSAPSVAIAAPVHASFTGNVAGSVAKRAFDIAAAAAALLLLAPLMVLVAAAVYVTSPGRVVFRQDRLGLNGRRFKIIKFRTMVADAERRLQTDRVLRQLYLSNNHKVPAHLDTRITRVGRFLRATSLDELPQFWNVLMGHMSLVGPRPIVVGEISRYGEAAAIYESVRPGLTGLWQASGRSTVSYDERVKMDVRYVCNWSFANDVLIILKTIPAVIGQHGSH